MGGISMWYDKYLQVYEKPFDAVSFGDIVSKVKVQLSAIQSDTPMVTVSVIAYNEERHLLACLWALSELKSKYPIEIIGVDNDSRDQTAAIYQAVGLPYYTEKQHSCGFARQCGLNHARGKYHVNVDADTLYPSTYVDNVIDVMEKNLDIVGVSTTWSYIPDAHHSRMGIFFYTHFRDFYLRLLSVKRPELSVRGLVFTYRTELARQVGIRTHIIRGEDGALAFGLRRFGRLAFIRNKRVRAVTGYGTMSESLWKSFLHRVNYQLKGIRRLFTKAKEYKDQESNLVKP